jgi:hypothetical protein
MNRYNGVPGQKKNEDIMEGTPETAKLERRCTA